MRFTYASIAALMGAMLILSIAFAVMNLTAARAPSAAALGSDRGQLN